ncbi:hypothetical protein [Pseudonocardia endophytica]|uniref:HD domain-containing protein n=1 Tax=Pseudonocardia endophytica TaxID=401976 RepID=A0A4R1HTK9_PSEEN|nr:hypothetical protein [Pseudonocardia endophytica]TCK26007.1 hypothetical protein EV378_1834 [Pseudonocardia endophytica]
MTGFDAARALAENLLAAQSPARWARAQRAAIRVRELAEEAGADVVTLMTAAVLHPVGASPVVRRTGDERADAARFLAVRGLDPAVVALVGGAGTDPEAAVLRRCLDELDAEARQEPPPAAVARARANPGSWVYAIDDGHDPDGDVPPEAIRGAWPVNDAGEIDGAFVPNPNHRPAAGGDA